MRRLLLYCLMIVLLISGCSSGGYRDKQIYIVNKGGNAPEKDELLSWLSVTGPKPFRTPQWSQEALKEGDVPLYFDEKNRRLWLMADNDLARLDLSGVSILGRTSRSMTLVSLDLDSGKRETMLSDIPFVSKIRRREEGGHLYLYGGGTLTNIDLKRGTATKEEAALQDGYLQNAFVSPLEPGKLYLDVAGVPGGSAYYPASSRSLFLYQTRERLYYKALLEDRYYYATKWHDNEQESGDLWTVIADDRDQVVRLLGRGSYYDAYEKSVLLLAENGFKLNLIYDLNVPEEAKNLSDSYICDAGFYRDGGIYWIVEKGGDKPFVLYLANAKGEVQQKLPLTGSELLLNEAGDRGYGSGVGREEVDLIAGKIIRDSAYDLPYELSDQRLLSLLRKTVKGYGAYRLGNKAALDPLLEAALTDELRADLTVVPPLTSTHHTAPYINAILTDGYVTPEGNAAEFGLRLFAIDKSGQTLTARQRVRYYYNLNEWKIERFSTEDGH